MMKMKAVDRLPLPAGKSVELSPGGYHMMLFDLKAPLKAGDVVPPHAHVRGQRRQEIHGRSEGLGKGAHRRRAPTSKP